VHELYFVFCDQIQYMSSTCILDNERCERKIQRMALEIRERNSDSQDILIAGIATTGLEVAKRLAHYIESGSGKSIAVHAIRLNKSNPLEKPVETTIHEKDLQNAVLILVDDVQNSGRTLLYAIRHFLDFPIKAVQSCVLIDRRHNLFPVRADYVGTSLSTTLQEHVEVKFEDDKFSVWLH